MAGLRVEFAQFGDFDSFAIYRSDTPMNISSMPAPIATGLSTMYFVDTSAIVGRSYYYRVSVLRDGDIEISDEAFIKVTTSVLKAFKWVRLTNIITRLEQPVRDPVEIVFYDKSRASLITTSNKAFSAATLSGNPASNAFDNNLNTLVYSDTSYNQSNILNWHIGYEFAAVKNVRYVGIKQRSDLPPSLGREFQKADVQVSANGIHWIDSGTINPLIQAENSSLVIAYVEPLSVIPIPTDYILRYDFSGNLLDKSTNGLNGVKLGTTSYVTGRKTGTQCLSFVNGEVSTPAVLPINGPYLSVSFWYKTTSTGVMIIYETSGDSNINSGAVVGVFNDVTPNTIQSTIKASDTSFNIVNSEIIYNNWTHVLIMTDRTKQAEYEQRIYVNNVLTSSINTTQPSFGDTITGNFENYILNIGRRKDGGLAPYKGLLQDMRFYNRWLNKEERLALFSE